MARMVTVTWPTDDGSKFTLRKEMEDEEVVHLMRVLENDMDFEAVEEEE